MKTYALITAVVVGLSVAGCYYDNQQDLYPSSSNATCDTTGVTLSGTLMPILNANCNSQCHSSTLAPTLGNNIKLDTYTGIQPYAANGHLIGAITHSAGFYAMPLSGSPLTPCDIADF